jgi:hypothetical protein
MNANIDVLAEAYTILKQYIVAKDRQEAADNLVSVLVDMLDDQELATLGSTDSYLSRAIKEYSGDQELSEDDFTDEV